MTDPRTTYQQRITEDTAWRDHYRRVEAAAPEGSTRQKDARHSAESRERMIATHAAKLAALESVTACQRSMFEEAA